MSSAVERPRTAKGATARTVAQAKLNLFLRVLAREASGYHQLETLFCRLDIGDDVVVRTNVRGRSLECTGDAIPPEGLGPTERNLAWRAAAAYSAATAWPNDWAIEITKRIPVGGGMGGGSADAGAVLRCLNAVSPRSLSEHELLSIAAPLGADVPFLSIDAPLALAWGRGERLLKLPPLPSRDVTLITCPFGVATRDAYGWLDDAGGAGGSAADALSLHDLSAWSGVSRLAHNDVEFVVAERVSEVAASLSMLRTTLQAGGDRNGIVMLAGSGATVFLLSDDTPTGDLRAPGVASRTLRTRTTTRVVDVELSG
jgi:4-diphosphocytidyl-2-C-methyl-D-erythritol kinase